MPRPQVRTSAQADHGHSGSQGGADTVGAILDHHAICGGNTHSLSRKKENLWMRFSALNHFRTENVGAKLACQTKNIKTNLQAIKGA